MVKKEEKNKNALQRNRRTMVTKINNNINVRFKNRKMKECKENSKKGNHTNPAQALPCSWTSRTVDRQRVRLVKEAVADNWTM